MKSYASLLFLLIALTLALPAAAAIHKLRVKDPATAAALLAQGGKFIADYGSFQVIEADSATPGLAGVGKNIEVDADADFIELHAARLDTRAAPIQARRTKLAAFAGQRTHLIQFAGPVKPEWYAALEQTGVHIVTYIPNDAYLVYADSAALTRLQAWAGTNTLVQWEGGYADDYKIHPAARLTNSIGQTRVIGTDIFSIQLVEDSAANSNTLALINSLKLDNDVSQNNALGYLNIRVRLPAAQLASVSAQPDVVSILPYFPAQKFCERQGQIMAGNLTGNSPTGPGYLTWLASKGFTQAQFDASGFVVDVTDSGIDNGTTAPNHFGLFKTGNTGSTSRVAYNRLEGTANASSTIQGCDGHGNLNSHIIGGYDDLANFPFADGSGFHYGLGICPFVRLGSSVIFDPSTYTSPNFPNLMSRAYRDGARVSNHSWGANTAGAYDSTAQIFDSLVRDAQPTGSAVPVAGNQEIVLVVAAGNAGSGAQTVGSPGTAKNIITAGAGENVQPFGGSDGSGIADTGADSANDLISFSSRGPCADGRIKPDLCAPGTHVSGGVAQAANPAATGTQIACYDGSGVSGGVSSIFFPSSGQQFYTASSGTSHSTPGISGACALVRQYFINQLTNPPSAAMTKAYLVNSARYMSGTGAGDTLPSNNQGMGSVNLGMAFDGVPRILRDQVSADTFTATGQTRTFNGTITDNTKPFRVTLAWTDAPGNTSGNAYNNNLDLTVTVGGNTYKGNVFSGANSVTGGTADAKNNLESVFLPAGVTGPITVTITAANIVSDGVPNVAPPLDQDFALVIYNANVTTIPVINPAGFSLSAESCAPTNGVIDSGETVTVNFALNNVGSANTTNLVVTLLATNGVLAPSSPQSYGVVNTNGTVVSQPFSFTANGACGSTITAIFHAQDGAQALGDFSQTFGLGSVSTNITTFTNGTNITILDNASASPYPAAITVSGVSSSFSKVTVSVRGISHTYPDDIDMILVGPTGLKTYLMSDAGGGGDIVGVTFTFDDAAAATLSDAGQLVSGTYKPSNYDTSSDAFAAPAPASPYSTNLSIFNGVNPNGTWSLYVRDDAAVDTGTITNGWTLSFATTTTNCCSSVAPSADLALGQSVAPTNVNLNGSATFTLSVTNLGPDTATNVVVSNTLPAGLNFVAAAPAATATNGSTLTFAFGNLASGAKTNITIQTTAGTAGARTNTAAATSATTDPTGANNSATAIVTVNAPPTISPIANVTTNQNTVAGPITFTVGDAETAAAALTLSGTSSNTNLVPTANIAFGGSSSNRTVTLTPAANQIGGTTITVTVSDGSTNTSTAFTLTVNQVLHAPVVAAITNRTIFWLNPLAFTVSATSTDVPPQTLTYNLGTNAPVGAAINSTNGAFTWTPTTAQAPTTNPISVIVADSGAPLLTTTQSFTITVLQSNLPPVLAAISNHTIYDLNSLVFTNIATDTNLPPQTLTFSLDTNAPAGATVTTNGVFTWTPTFAQSPSTNLINVIVTDDGTPSLSATQSFTVTVLQSNLPPVLPAISNQTIYWLNTLTLTNSATDSNLPPQNLTFSLDTNAPGGATVTTNGLFTWTPATNQAPSTNLVSLIVTDDGTPSLSATQSFTVTVLQSNLPPVLAAIADRTVHAGSLVQFTNSATDPNQPAQSLAYSLDLGAGPGVSLNVTNGVFAWTPGLGFAGTTNDFTVRVTDDGVPPLSDTKNFAVTVVAPPTILSGTLSNDLVTLTWTAIPSQSYRMQLKPDLTLSNWTDVLGDVTATNNIATGTNAANGATQEFYRVLVLP